MLVATLVSIALLGQQKPDDLLWKEFGPNPRKPFFSLLFPKPTGKNGLEYYVRAADLGQKDRRILQLAIAKPPVSISDPDVRSGMAALDGALKLMAEGTRHPIDLTPLKPKPNAGAEGIALLTANIIFPLDAELKTITKGTVNAADVWLSQGHSMTATQNLLLMLRVSHDLIPMSLDSALVGIAMDSIIYAAFDRHMADFALRDLDLIVAATGKLETDDVYRRSLLAEADDSTAGVLVLLKEVDKEARKGGGELRKDKDERLLLELYMKSKPAQRSGYPGAIRTAVRKKFDWVIRQIPAWTFKAVPAGTKWSADPFVDKMVGTMVFAEPIILDGFATTRIQMRLLRLHAFIQRYKLIHKRLPDTLAQLKLPAKETYDPLAQKQFSYGPYGYGYTLCSEGNLHLGKIELVRKRK